MTAGQTTTTQADLQAPAGIPVPSPTETRYLTPGQARVHLGNHGAMHVTVAGERIYGGVYAVYAFPVRHPSRYISLRHITSKGDDIEVGIIRDLEEWPPADRRLVEEALKRHYFVHTITSIEAVSWKFGFVSLDVLTDKGPVSFLMRWQHDRALDYGKSGKVLLDVDENRYLIPDVQALPPKQREDFLRYIYW
jgi:hypothetical protein